MSDEKAEGRGPMELATDSNECFRPLQECLFLETFSSSIPTSRFFFACWRLFSSADVSKSGEVKLWRRNRSSSFFGWFDLFDLLFKFFTDKLCDWVYIVREVSALQTSMSMKDGD